MLTRVLQFFTSQRREKQFFHTASPQYCFLPTDGQSSWSRGLATRRYAAGVRQPTASLCQAGATESFSSVCRESCQTLTAALLSLRSILFPIPAEMCKNCCSAPQFLFLQDVRTQVRFARYNKLSRKAGPPRRAQRQSRWRGRGNGRAAPVPSTAGFSKPCAARRACLFAKIG